MPAEKTSLQDRLFRNVLFVAMTFAVVLFVCTFVTILSEGRAALLIVPGAAVVLATFELSAMWAVLGLGSFLQRSATAFGFAFLVALGGFIGASLPFIGEIGFDEFLIGAVTTLASIPFLWLMAQLPFWIFRGLFGWHLATWSPPSKRSPMTIRDMLAITGLIAIALAGVRLSFFSVRGEIGEADMLSVLAFSIIPLSIYSVAIFLLFTMPAMLLILRPEKQDEGCQWYAGISIAILIMLLGLALAVLGGAPEVAAIMGGFLGLYCLAIGLLMLVLRDSNIVLYSRGRERRWLGQTPTERGSQEGRGAECAAEEHPSSKDRPADPLGIEDNLES